jgi:hypothetical protein
VQRFSQQIGKESSAFSLKLVRCTTAYTIEKANGMQFLWLYQSETQDQACRNSFNFLTDGAIMQDRSPLSMAWAQALAIDNSLGIVFVNGFQAAREHDRIKACCLIQWRRRTLAM